MLASAEKRPIIFCLILVAATLAFYNPVVRNGFTDFDDSAYILKNPQVQTGLTWDTVKWSFTTFHDGIWHPLTWMSHALDCQIFRLNPAGHHYVSLLLHAACAVLLFLLLLQATGLLWPSFLVGALFALHPANVESVAWIAERKNVLSMLFFLLALLAYDRYARTGRKYLFWWVTLAFAFGLLAKPQIVTLPFVLLLWDYWPLQRLHWGREGGPALGSTPRSIGYLVLEKLPLFALAAADSVITVIAEHAGGAVRTTEEFSMSARLENVVVSYVRYMGKMFWPSRLAPMYPHPGNSLAGWQVAGAAVVLLIVSALVLRWHQRRYLLVGWFWFLGTLVPVIGLVAVGEQAMADRYAYIPFIGLFVAVVWGLAELSAENRIAGKALAGTAVIAVFILGSLTCRQLGYWHDDETLWRYTLSVTERNYMAHDNLALALAKQGRTDEAVTEFRAANALHRYPPVQVLALALYEARVGHPREAIEECNSILRASADPAVQSATWSALGQTHLQLREFDQAADSYENALRLNPENAASLVGSAMLEMRQRQYDGAVDQLSHAAKVDPSDVNFLLLSEALRRAGHSAEADSAAAQARKISPNLGEAQNNVGQILSVVGNDSDMAALRGISTAGTPGKNASKPTQ
jgi:tetratricopeptide (TPR) repeat protein